MKMCMHFKLIGKMGAGAEQEYTMDKEKKILNQIQPVSCPAPISLYFSAFLYISLHFSTFLCISLNVSAFRCISLHFSTFHFKRNLFHMKSSVGIYTLVLWFRIFLSESKAFLYLLGLRGPLWLEEILHKRIFSWDAHLESKYMSQKRICFCEQSVYAESPLPHF